MNDKTNEAKQITEEAVRAHRTTGVRLGVVHEEQKGYDGLAIDKVTGEKFPMHQVKQLMIMNDMRYAVYGTIIFDMNTEDARIMHIDVQYGEGNPDGRNPDSIFFHELDRSKNPGYPQPKATDEAGEDAHADLMATEFKQLVALGIRAAELHRDLVAPAESIHHCGNPSCIGEGKLPSEIAGGRPVNYIDLNEAAPAAGTAIH